MAAKPIKISILADASAATASVGRFASTVDTDVGGATRRLGTATEDTRRSLDSVRDGFDTGEQRAQGFRDGLTGAQDSMAGFSALAKGDTVGGLLLLGSGAADTASSFANFLIPAFQKGIGWIKNLTIVQRLLNLTMLSNPVFLVVAAIVALVAVIVIAYKKSETFRKIVQTGWKAIQAVATAVWNAIKAVVLAVTNAIIGYVRAYRAVVVAVWNAIKGAAQAVWNAIKGAILRVHTAIVGYIRAYRAIVTAVWNTIKGAAVTAWNSIKAVIAGAINGARSIVQTAVSRIRGLFSASTLLSAGRDLIAGLIRGITQKIGDAVATVRAGVAKIRDLLPGSPIRSGPLRSWNNGGAGKRLMDLLASGIRSGAPTVSAALSDGITARATIGTVGSVDTTRRDTASAADRLTLEIKSGGSRLDDLLVEILRRSIRVSGGNVQTVLGGR